MSAAKRDFERWQEANDNAIQLLIRIQDALGTQESGDALVEVARTAHRAERQVARLAKLALDLIDRIGDWGQEQSIQAVRNYAADIGIERESF